MSFQDPSRLSAQRYFSFLIVLHSHLHSLHRRHGIRATRKVGDRRDVLSCSLTARRASAVYRVASSIVLCERRSGLESGRVVQSCKMLDKVLGCEASRRVWTQA